MHGGANGGALMCVVCGGAAPIMCQVVPVLPETTRRKREIRRKKEKRWRPNSNIDGAVNILVWLEYACILNRIFQQTQTMWKNVEFVLQVTNQEEGNDIKLELVLRVRPDEEMALHAVSLALLAVCR